MEKVKQENFSLNVVELGYDNLEEFVSESGWRTQGKNLNFGEDSFIDEKVEQDDLRFRNRKICLRKDSYSDIIDEEEQKLLDEFELGSYLI